MNISLIGMMGSGKTTISKILSEKLLDYKFIDTDEEIVKQQNMSVNEIFAKKGEGEFRKIEAKLLKKILNNDNQIISTGGGIILSDENIKILKEKSLVFYLKADEEILYNRVKNDTQRPLLKNGDLKQKIHSILKQREERYKISSHHVINTDKKEPIEVAQEIIGKTGINADR